MSVIIDVQTNRVCALSITLTSYFCLNTAQYIHVVEYSECFITDARVCVGDVCEDQWCLCAYRRSKQFGTTNRNYLLMAS